MEKSVQGILLTGGQSRRMGQNKSTLDLGNKNFTEHIIDALKNVTKDILIVGPIANYRNYKGLFFDDIVKDKGPAAGILTGLINNQHDLNIVLSCDVPLIQQELLSDLLRSYNGQDVLICRTEEGLHPLVGIYHKRCKAVFKSCIERNVLKLKSITDELNVGFYDVSHKWENQLMNINSPAQYEKLKNEYSN